MSSPGPARSEIADTDFLGFELELKRNADRIREAGSMI
jgi:hypothetical protein